MLARDLIMARSAALEEIRHAREAEVEFARYSDEQLRQMADAIDPDDEDEQAQLRHRLRAELGRRIAERRKG